MGEIIEFIIIFTEFDDGSLQSVHPTHHYIRVMCRDVSTHVWACSQIYKFKVSLKGRIWNEEPTKVIDIAQRISKLR